MIKNRRETIRLLKKDGWVLVANKGDHKQFKHPIKKGKVTVPYYITTRVYHSILKQAGLKGKV